MRFALTYLAKKLVRELRAWKGLLSPLVGAAKRALRIVFERKTSMPEKVRRLGTTWRGAGWENLHPDNIRHSLT